MKRFIIFAAVLVFLSLSFANIAPQNAHDLFQKALAKERAEGNLEEAIALYQRVVKEAKDESLGAKAQLHIGFCYEKLGLKEAQKAYQKVIDNYPQQTEAVKMAKEKLEVLLRARTLVEKEKKEYKVTMIHSGTEYPDSLSPDEKKLALSNSQDWDIWLKDVATGEQVKLTDETNMIRGMVWSPDSKMIAFGDNLHNVYVVSSKGGPSKMIIEADPDSVKSKDAISISGWTSDSKKIVFQIPSRGLFAIPASGGEWEKIFTFKDSEKAKEHEEMTLSPDGQLIACSSTQNGNKDIYVIPVQGGESVRVTDNPAADSGPQWSYDGKWLSFFSRRTETPEVWAVRISPEGKPNGMPFQISRGGAYDGGWTGDNKFGYTSVRRAEHIHIVNEDKNEEFQLTTFPAFNKDPRWSPDGKMIAFSSDYGLHINYFRIWIVPSSGGEARLLTRGDYPSWSPDGKMIAFCTNRAISRTQGESKISIIPVEGGEPKEIITLDKAINFVDWSPDGKNIVFCLDIRPDQYANVQDFLRKYQRSIYTIPVEGGKSVRITQDKPGLQTTSCRWSPDGKKIAIRALDYVEGQKSGNKEVAGNPGFGIFTIDVESGERRLITRELDGWVLNWSPDGKYIISSKYEKGTKESWVKGHFIYRVSSEGGKLEKLNIKGRCPAYSPDGKKIAFSRRLEGYYEFWLVENFLHEGRK